MSAQPSAIARAASTLMRGELVAFPTETVYGLGADAANPEAVARIYAAKGRPSHHPVIVHIANPKDMQAWCCDIPAQAWQLADAFWPGPLTLILRRHPEVDASVSGGQSTIGVRCPSHPVAHDLLLTFAALKRQAGEPRAGVAAPSANRFGRVSPTRAQHVHDEFADHIAQGMPVLEGGDSEVGIESTIVDLSSVAQGATVAVLRPGAISSQQIEAVLGTPVSGGHTASPRVSGSLKAHYAPRTPVKLLDPEAVVATVEDWLAKHHGRLGLLTRNPALKSSERVTVIPMPAQAADYAHNLYAHLRALDEQDLAIGVIETVPNDPAWAGVRDRLSRAAAAFEDQDMPAAGTPD